MVHIFRVANGGSEGRIFVPQRQLFIVVGVLCVVATHTLVLKGARIRAPVRASGAQCVHLV